MQQKPVQWAVALHGGAGVISKTLEYHLKDNYEKALQDAINLGTQLAQDGKTALDVVEQVVKNLEDNPLFNAGKGSVFNTKGYHELEASIMCGKTLKCGACTGVQTIKNPISLARKIMENTRFILLQGQGAEMFADTIGNQIERVKQEYFFVQNRYDQLQRALQTQSVTLDHTDMKDQENEQQKQTKEELNKKYQETNTVGCVCMDINGNLAAATSTGGLTNKMVGRTGDTPQIGAGTYANDIIAISGTGTGEQFIRNCICFDVQAVMKYKNLNVKEACYEVIHKNKNFFPDDGGVIAISNKGEIAMEFNSLGMFRASSNSLGETIVKIWE